MTNLQTHINFAKRNGWLPHYYEAATYYDIPVEILLAKDSHESGLGSYPGLQANDWYGSDGISRGISQINTEQWPFARYTDPNDVRAYVAKGAEILRNELNRFNDMHTALAAYNAGAGRVRMAIGNGKDPDSVTTSGNYAADILNRSRYIKNILSGNPELQAPATANIPLFTALILGSAALAAAYNYKPKN